MLTGHYDQILNLQKQCFAHFPELEELSLSNVGQVSKGNVYSRVYQNLAILSENYRTFPKVGPHYKEKACKFLARSD